MKLSEIPSALQTARDAGLSVYIKGPPGNGKTAIVRQFADANNMELIHIHAPLTDLLDIKGVISTKEDKAQFLPLSIWPEETDDPVVVLIDELPQCVPAIQNAFSQLLIDKQMGDIRLPENSIVIATGNRREDKAATNNMPSHVTNRVLHIEVDRNSEDFFTYATRNRFDPSITAFLRFKPDCVYTFDARNTQDPYATYRSWEFVDKVLKSGPNEGLLPEILRGLIGEAAREFTAYRRLCADLPDIPHLLRHPDQFVVPSNPGLLYAIATALAANVNKDTIASFFELIHQLPTEFSVLSVRDARTTLPTIEKHKEFGIWAKANLDIIL